MGKESFQKIVVEILTTRAYTLREAQTIARYVEEDVFRNVAQEHRSVLEESVLSRLSQGEPWQYISGKAHFYGLDFKVSPAVLIPRMETEELVYQVLKRLPENKKTTLVDIGTGSGIIALTIARNRPLTEVWGIDISDEALKIAEWNRQNHNIGNVKWLKMNFLHPAEWLQLPAFDFLVSNPPYIPASEKNYMSASTIEFEPHCALFTQHHPMEFYQKIAECAGTQFRPVQIFTEINEFRSHEVLQTFEENGLTEMEVLCDLQGKDRIVKALKS